jgi:hypothetical protein
MRTSAVLLVKRQVPRGHTAKDGFRAVDLKHRLCCVDRTFRLADTLTLLSVFHLYAQRRLDLKVWSNCKLGIKLRATFALVMLIFVAAIVGMSTTVERILAAQGFEATRLIPARVAALDARGIFRTADDALIRYAASAGAQVASENDTISKLVLLGRALAIALSLLALLLGFAIATLFSRSILRSIGATSLAIREIVAEDIATLTLTLKRLAKGDLTGRFASSRALLAVKGSDEWRRWHTQYTAATNNLRDSDLGRRHDQ